MDGIAEILVPISGTAMIVAIIVGPIWIVSFFRSRERQRLHETLRVMVEKGQPVSAELLETLNSRVKPRKPANDLRRGVMLVAVGLGLAGIGLALGLTGDGDAVGPLCGIAAFLAFIGLGYVVLGIVTRDKPKA